MKEQPIETKEHVIGHSIGQRPIHTTYEPPGPLPQFRARPKLSPAQPQQAPKQAPKRLLNVAAAVKQTQQNASPEAPPERKNTASEKAG